MVVPIFELVCKPFLKGAYSGGSILDEAAVHIVDGEALRWLGCEPGRRCFTERPVHIVGYADIGITHTMPTPDYADLAPETRLGGGDRCDEVGIIRTT